MTFWATSSAARSPWRRDAAAEDDRLVLGEEDVDPSVLQQLGVVGVGVMGHG